MRIARSWKVAAVLGVAATLALTACTQKSQSGGGAGTGSGGSGGGGAVKVAFVPEAAGRALLRGDEHGRPEGGEPSWATSSGSTRARRRPTPPRRPTSCARSSSRRSTR